MIVNSELIVLEDQFQLPDGFDGVVRLFPLPNLVLFPCNLQPLHIFESRYREMFEDAINSNHLIAMATLAPDFEYEYFSRPPVHDTVCIGRICDYQKREDGKYDLVLLGLKRARIIQEEEPVRSYREATIEIIDDAVEAPSEQGLAGKQLLERFSLIAPETETILDAFKSGELELRHFVDIMAFNYPFDLEFEIKLLKEPSAKRRAEMMLEKLPKPETGAEPPPFSLN